MNPTVTTQPADQIFDLAKQIQGASSFRSAELAKQIAALADDFRSQQEHFAMALTEAGQTAGVRHAVEEIRLAIESATKAPAVAMMDRMAALADDFRKQQEDLVTALSEAAQPPAGLQRAVEGVRLAIESATKARVAAMAEQMTQNLRRMQEQQEEMLRMQADLLNELSQKLVESVREVSRAPESSG